MHKTIDWYQHLLFGSSESVGDTETGGVAAGLDAILDEMNINDDEVSIPSDSCARIIMQGGIPCFVMLKFTVGSRSRCSTSSYLS
jgi:hypothetical protein